MIDMSTVDFSLGVEAFIEDTLLPTLKEASPKNVCLGYENVPNQAQASVFNLALWRKMTYETSIFDKVYSLLLSEKTSSTIKMESLNVAIKGVAHRIKEAERADREAQTYKKYHVEKDNR